MLNPRRAKYHGQVSNIQRVRVVWTGIVSAVFLLLGMTGVHAGQLSLTWQDNSDNEDGFEIERARLGEGFGLLTTVGADAEAYMDASIVPGREYEYRVRAFNAFGYSGYTNVSVGMMPNTAPSLGDLEDISVLKGEDLPAVEFSFADAESDAADLVVEAISSNLALVPLTGISVELGDGTGTVSVNPTSSATGSAVVTLLLSDGVDVAQKTFTVEVLRNLAPTVGSISAVDAFDGQAVGPVAFTISDAETAASELTVVGTSMDESLIASDSISIGGSGANRTVSFATQSVVSGSTTIRLAVSDGVNSTNGVLRVNITKNAAPVISGLEDNYTIEGDGSINALAFTLSDRDTALSSLDVSVSSSNSLIASQFGLKLKGTGSQRTLDITPNPGMTGTVVVTVSVSDGIQTAAQSFNLRVVAPEQVVKILGFTVDQSLAVVEVENRQNATFSLWKIHSVDGVWERVEDVKTVVGSQSTTLIDPTPIGAPVCYRVIASE